MKAQRDQASSSRPVSPAAAARPAVEPLAQQPGDRRAMGVMTAAHGIQHFYVAGLTVTYPFVVADFHITYGLLGVILTVAGVAGGLMQMGAGLLRGASARAVLTLQNLGMAAASFGGAVSPGIATFAAARLGGALVSWPQHPVGSAYLSDRFPKRRATVLSWHTAGGSAGTVAIPLLVSAIITTAGWRWALVALGGALALGAVLVWVALPTEHRCADQKDETDRDAPAVSLWSLLTRRRVAAVLAASTVAAGGRGLGTLSTYIPAYLRTGLHLSALEVGGVFTVVMAASIVGPLAGGALADRFGRYRTLVVTYLGAAVAIAAFGVIGRHLVLLGVVGLAVGVLAYAESPLLQALFSDLTTDARSRSAFGIFFAIAYGVGALWTAVIGIVIDRAGFAVAFGLMAGSFVVAAGILVALARE